MDEGCEKSFYVVVPYHRSDKFTTLFDRYLQKSSIDILTLRRKIPSIDSYLSTLDFDRFSFENHSKTEIIKIHQKINLQLFFNHFWLTLTHLDHHGFLSNFYRSYFRRFSTTLTNLDHHGFLPKFYRSYFLPLSTILTHLDHNCFYWTSRVVSFDYFNPSGPSWVSIELHSKKFRIILKTLHTVDFIEIHFF